MSIIVQKFGGSSLASLKMIKRVALKIVDTYNKKNEVVVILSAMNKVTNELIKLANKISLDPDKREMDVLISTGEQVTVSLLAIILNKMGYSSKSFLAHQLKIITDSIFSNANILKINVQKIKNALIKKNIAIVAGFQGTDINKNITTLGRGGSDTTALALAIALNAKLCEIYTDVDGIHTADPEVYSKAKKIKKISYNHILHMSDSGSKVLHKPSIIIAKKNKLKIHVKCSFNKKSGSVVLNYNSKKKKKNSIGISCDAEYCKILLKKIKNKHINKIIGLLKPSNNSTKLLFMKKSNYGYINCILKLRNINPTKILYKYESEVSTSKLIIKDKIIKISVVRYKLLNKLSYSSNITKLLIINKVKADVVNISKEKISYLVKKQKFETAINKMHNFLNLK